MMFKNRLVKVFRHFGKQARKAGVTCYRVYDHDLPEFPFCIEVYEDKIYVAEYERRHGLAEEAHAYWLSECVKVIAEVFEKSLDNIFLRTRQRKKGRQGQYQKLESSSEEMIVKENGLSFIVNLTDYLDTGLFLDHRVSRKTIHDAAAGKTVLNLFAYTGSFSVYAAAGGASQVTTVDLSNTYLNWARRNMKLNGFENEEKYSFLQADVIQYLKQSSPRKFDIIVMDPPTFSNSQRMEGFLDIQRNHAGLINDAINQLNENGLLLFSTNARNFKLDEGSIQSSRIKDVTKATTPFDFVGHFSRFCFMIYK